MCYGLSFSQEVRKRFSWDIQGARQKKHHGYDGRLIFKNPSSGFPALKVVPSLPSRTLPYKEWVTSPCCQTKPEASGQTDRNRPGRGVDEEEEGSFLPCVIVTVARVGDAVGDLWHPVLHWWGLEHAGTGLREVAVMHGRMGTTTTTSKYWALVVLNSTSTCPQPLRSSWKGKEDLS